MVKSLIKDIYLSLRKFVLKILVKNKSCDGICPESVDSILVIRIDRIGDCVVSLPAIKALKRVFPKATLSVLVKKAHVALMKQAGYIDEVIAYDGFFSTVGILRKKHFSLAVDLLKDYTIKTALLALWGKAKITAGFAIEDRGRLFDLAFQPSEKKKRMSSHLVDLIRFIAQRSGVDCADIADEAPEIVRTQELKAFAGEFLLKEGVSKENIIVGLAPGGNYPSQRWKLENFAQLANSLSDRYNARIIIIAGKQEEKSIVKLASLVRIKPILAVGLPLDKLAAVIASVRILICNNSGPLHIAAALGVPTVSTMGPTDPALWWPHGENNIVINRQLPCSPCDRAECKHHSCLAQIGVTEIEQAVDVLLKKAGAGTKMAQERAGIQKETIKRVLIINLGGIGDVLLSTPALRALQQGYPGAELYLLVVPRVAEAVKGLTYVKKVFIFDIGAGWYGAWRNFRELSRLRAAGIDLAVNMRTFVSEESAAKMRALMSFINPRIKAGRNTAGRGDFFDIKIPEEDVGTKFEMEYDLETAKALGAGITDRTIDFQVDQTSIRVVNELLRGYGIDDTAAIIGIHPGGKPSHRWAAENFARVLAELSKVSRARFVITGDKHEVSLAEMIIKNSNVNAVNLAGKLSLRELGALLTRCSLYICNDTGAMHIAAFVGAPLVALFGPGYLDRYDPRKISAHAIVLYQKKDCAPCNKTDCATMRCMESISPGEVVSAAQMLLEQTKGAHP